MLVEIAAVLLIAIHLVGCVFENQLLAIVPLWPWGLYGLSLLPRRSPLQVPSAPDTRRGTPPR